MLDDLDALVADAIADHTVPVSGDDVVHSALRDRVRERKAQHVRVCAVLGAGPLSLARAYLAEQVTGNTSNLSERTVIEIARAIAALELLVQRDDELRAEVLRDAT